MEEQLALSRERVHELGERVEDQERERAEESARMKEMEKTVRAMSREGEEEQGALREELSDTRDRFGELERRVKEEEERRAQDRVKRSARSRVLLLLVMWLMGAGVVSVCAAVWGSGDNLYQRVLHSWPLLIGTAVIPTGLGYLLLGKERIGTLSRSVRGLLRIGGDST